jgi:acetyl-CoA C-acetyltransferase
VLASPMISDPLHRLDCCVVSDGGGAVILVAPEIVKSLKKPLVRIIGAGESPKGQMGGKIDLTYSGAAVSGPIAFAEAGITPADIKYASIYDSFTITVLMQLEDLGFCRKGEGGRFVADGNLISGVGKLPFNTDALTAREQRSKKAWPAVVNDSLRVERCISRLPRRSSSCATLRLTELGGMFRRRPAAAKLPARTTSTNSATSFRSSTTLLPFLDE